MNLDLLLNVRIKSVLDAAEADKIGVHKSTQTPFWFGGNGMIMLGWCASRIMWDDLKEFSSLCKNQFNANRVIAEQMIE